MSSNTVSFKKMFPQITKDYLAEVKTRLKTSSVEELINNLSKVVLEIFSEPVSVYYNSAENKMCFLPSSYYSAKEQNNPESFDSYLSAINKFLSSKYKNESSSKIKDEISKHIDKELYKLSSKLNNLQKRIEDGSKEEIYKSYGNLLLANIHLLTEKNEVIIVTDYLTNEEVKIKLNAKIQPKQNVDWYFENHVTKNKF